ncbi:MAG: HrgA protein [Campylobacter sp.]|nr:HrgA protein [Campylobacter sp.]
MTFLELTQVVLEKAETPLTCGQIWKYAEKLKLTRKLGNIGKTPEASLRSVIYISIRDKNKTPLLIISEQPRTFWLKSREKELKNLKTNELEIEDFARQKRAFNERDLHSLFVKFLKDSEFDAYAKTIYHEVSTKSQKGKDKWNFPDIVAVHFPFNDYRDETLTLAKHTNQNQVEIYSFELKVALDWGNLKESYFQAVSNSSFANEGYLVVFEDIDDKEILEEIERLNQSFGIGLLQLGLDDIKIIFPSKERELDFETIDMLIGKNPDFKKFIENVNKDFKTNDRDRIATQNYDKILGDEELKRYIKEKNITKD